MIPRIRRRSIVLVAGVFALLLGLAAFVDPALLPPAIRGVLATVAAAPLALLTTVFGVVAALGSLWTLTDRPPTRSLDTGWKSRSADGSAEGSAPAEAATGDATVRLVGAAFDDRLAALSDSSVPVTERERHRQEIRAELETAVVETLVRTRRRSPAEARALVATGEWTDDRRPAAFLAGPEGPSMPLTYRIRDWFRAESAFVVWTRRTTTALAAEARALEGGRS